MAKPEHRIVASRNGYKIQVLALFGLIYRDLMWTERSPWGELNSVREFPTMEDAHSYLEDGEYKQELRNKRVS